MNQLFVDISLLAHANLFVYKDQFKLSGYDFLKVLLLKNIFSHISQFKPKKVWIAFDSGVSWRKEFSNAYKEQRVAIREKQSVDSGGDIDWDAFYKALNELEKELKQYFKFWVIRIPTIEADDIIAHVVRNSNYSDEKTIVTRDGDYLQLMYYPNTKVYDPINRKYLSCPNPVYFLQHKICIGDRSDNILPIKPRFGDKTAEKFILAGELDKLLETANKDIKESGSPKDPLAVAYFKNKKLIDMSQIPKSLDKQISDTIESYQISDGKQMFKYFISNGYREMIEDISHIRDVTSSLI